jgi:hypothetical protein
MRCNFPPLAASLSLIISIVLPILSVTAHAEDRLAKIYDNGQTSGKTEGTPAFVERVHLERTPDGRTEKLTTIEDAQGKIMVTEHASYQKDRLISQRIEQLQAQLVYEVTVANKKVTFRTFPLQDGHVGPLQTEKSEDVSPDFITSPTTENFLKENWPLIMKGDTIHARFGVVERSETVGFKFWKTGESEENGKKFVTIRMKPSSIFVAAVVDPIDIHIDTSTLRMTHYRGRTPLLRKVVGKWKPLDADILYTYN